MIETRISTSFSFRSFLKNYVTGSVLLVLATIVALIAANSSLSEVYNSFKNIEFSLMIGGFDVFQHNGHSMTLGAFVNDGLMAIFFFAVGLEIKREFIVGELSSTKHALLPIIAAAGGVILPVLIYRFIASDPMVLSGAAIPMATDIAFSLGVLSLLGKRVPLSLKVFLTALAVVDDLAGIIVIALFYANHIAPIYLAISAVLLALLVAGGKLGINSKSFYAVIGFLVWYMFLNSGVHATIAGVLVALCVPVRPRIATVKYINRIKENIEYFPYQTTEKNNAVILTNVQIGMLKSIEGASKNVISPLQKLEDMLHPVVTYFIIPVFAFMNAGLSLEGVSFDSFTSEITLAIMGGLLLGKTIGIFGFSYIAIKSKIVDMPKGMNYKGIAGVSILGAIGFTVSIFIGTLSYGSTPEGTDLLDKAKLGILTASLLAAVAGYLFIKFTHNEVEDELESEEQENNKH